MCGVDTYLYDITSHHTIYMVKTLLTERGGLRKDQQRLFLLTTILNNNRSLASYNIDNYSIIMVVQIPRGGKRTRLTTVLRVNNNSEVYSDTTDESNEIDERTGECLHYNDSGTYGTKCDNY